MPSPASARKNYPLSRAAANMMAGVQRRHNNWKQSTFETGTVNGLTFIRSYWQGTDIAFGKAMRGFTYVMMDGEGVLVLASQDLEEYAKNTLPLMEASVQTFRKP